MSSAPDPVFSDEALALLARPLTAVVSTTAANGAPLAVPVWYRFDGRRFTIWTATSRRWVRNLIARPGCALTVAEHEPPFAAVLVRGVAEVVSGEDWVGEEIRRITGRYIAADDVEGYVSGYGELQTIVVVRPRAVRAWGRGY